MKSGAVGFALDYRRTFLVGFGFLATMAAWGTYNANVPLILERSFGLSSVVIGAIMTIDNVLALFLQPLFGSLSDRTVTRWGRRLPYILVCLPVCAALFLFVPRMPSLAAMMMVTVAFNLVMSIWRAPNMALMPDVTPPAQRSMGSAVINLMGGVGGALALLVGGVLISRSGVTAAFAFCSALMAACWLVILLFVREPRASAAETAAARERELAEEAGNSGRRARRSFMILMICTLFWGLGYNAFGAFFTLYAVNALGVAAGHASLMLVVFSVAVIISAIPAGIMGTRFGRRRTILAGMIATVLLFAPVSVISSLALVRIVLVLFGLCMAMINVNAIPIVAEIAKSSRIGRYTGYYFIFVSLAAILGPTLFGWIRDLTQNYSSLFAFASSSYLAAVICMCFVRHGEASANAMQNGMIGAGTTGPDA